nr:hypothetical protein [Tanacetum cinerariifolium]
MLQILPKLPGQKFEDPLFEKAILSFIRDLGHTEEIKVLSDVNVNHMYQPWRSFATIINKCLSGKTTGHDSLRLSRAQIIWGMYHNKNADYVYLLWEDLVYQVENKNSMKNNEMCYPRFTKHDEEEQGSGLRVQTPSHFESTVDEAYDDVTQRDNVKEEKLEEDKTNEEEEVDELYSDVNINLEGRDTDMTDASLANVQATQVIEDTHVIMTIVAPKVQQQSSSISSGFISNMINPNLDTVVQLQSDKLREEAQAENEDFINKLDENIKKIIKEQVKEKTSKSTGKSKEGSKSHQKSTGNPAQAEEPIHTVKELEEYAPQEFNIAWKEDTRDLFNELIDTPLDFSAFVMNRLKVDALTPELLAGPTFDRMKGSCKSLVELEYFLEVVYKATTDQLDWNNPEGRKYPHDLRKPLPLITNSQGHRVIPFDHIINNDLMYLRGGVSSRTYATSVTKTKAADYRYIIWIED